MSRIYSWEEVISQTICVGKTHAPPIGAYNNCLFVKKEVFTSKIQKTYYLTLTQCKKLNLESDIDIIMDLMRAYKVNSVSPIILTKKYAIIDGSHRMGAIMELGIEKIEAFVLLNKK